MWPFRKHYCLEFVSKRVLDRVSVTPTLMLHAMKNTIYIFLMSVFFSCPGFSETRWEAYLAQPTPENASYVEKIEYSPEAIPDQNEYWAPDLDILRNQIQGGDKESFRLAFRLIQKSDGGLLEDLIVILSHTIRARPEFFLKEMSKLNPQRELLKMILLMPGLEYADRNDAKRYEINMRRKAISEISDPTLKNFQETCLALLKYN